MFYFECLDLCLVKHFTIGFKFYYLVEILMKLHRSFLSVVLSGIFALVLLAGTCLAATNAEDSKTENNTNSTSKKSSDSSASNDKKQIEKIPLADLQRFTNVVEHIKNYYVKSMDDADLFENAMRGMLAGLDPHSSYLDKEDYADLKALTTGKFGGLGIELIPEDGLIRVITPVDDTPAQRAGIQPGDIIVRLNETPVKGLSLREAIEMMRGEKGTTITLTIIRQGESKPLKIPVTRDTINVRSVRSEMLEDGFGYVRVSQFQSNSGDEFVTAVQNLKKTAGGKLKGLVIDLRNNPGGVLEASVQVADAFLDREKLAHDALIVYTKGRLLGGQIKEKAHSGDVLNGAPVVVLVNGGSASASEIVAGALQDHHRAVVLGTQTFGKGSVQTVFPLKDNRGLKLTTMLYYTPAGRSIQADGIKPDITVQNLKIPSPDADASSLLIREEDLKGHLENGSGQPAKKAVPVTNAAKEKDKKELPLMTRDYQLFEGLNILKGLSLVNQKKGD
jgi:carboxyl-terminal processing protease